MLVKNKENNILLAGRIYIKFLNNKSGPEIREYFRFSS